MKDFRLYAELPADRGSKAATKAHPQRFTVRYLKSLAAAGGRNNCVALDMSYDGWRYNPGGVAVALDGAPGSVGYTGLSLDYLGKRCVRVSEAVARKLHPELIAYLEWNP